VRALAKARVLYVLVGSVAARKYGVDVVPRDFDIVPESSTGNLRRLAGVLEELHARPHFDPDWPFSREECDAWTPEPASEENLDRLYDSAHGLFDVVPWRAGRYEELAPRAVVVDGIAVASVDDLIRQLRLHKPKHQQRLPLLEAVRAGRGSDGSPVI
jgi:hypothetical protein